MKKVILMFTFLLLSLVVLNPQSSFAKKEKALKDHVCTSACKDGCKFVHGEKGHTCTDACKEMSTHKESKAEMKEHKCTTECMDSKHIYIHGEKGHKCTKECMKKK